MRRKEAAPEGGETTNASRPVASTLAQEDVSILFLLVAGSLINRGLDIVDE